MTDAQPELFTGPVIGAVVTYHGSLTWLHGDCFYLGPGRLQHLATGFKLKNVRDASYDIRPVPVADIVRQGRTHARYHWTSTRDTRRAACGPLLDDSTAALPREVRAVDAHCTQPQCAERWRAWAEESYRAEQDGLRTLALAFLPRQRTERTD